MTEEILIVLAILMAGQLVLLIAIRNQLGIMSKNQQEMNTQAHQDSNLTADTLAEADTRRQTRDLDSGDDSINVKAN